MGERFEIGGLWDRLSVQELRGAHYALNLVRASPRISIPPPSVTVVDDLIEGVINAMATRDPAPLTTTRVRECPDRRHEPFLSSGHDMTFPLCGSEEVEYTSYCSTILLQGACPRGYTPEDEIQ
jgi:hypothetical protein